MQWTSVKLVICEDQLTAVDITRWVLQYSGLAVILSSPLSPLFPQHYLITHLFPPSPLLCKLPTAAVHWAIFLDVSWSSSSQQPSQQVIHQLPLPSSTLPGRCGHMAVPCPLVPAHNNRLQLSRGSSHHRLAIYLSVKVVIIYGPRQVTVVRLWNWRVQLGCSITRRFSLTRTECTADALLSSGVFFFYVFDRGKSLKFTSFNLAKKKTLPCVERKQRIMMW